MQTRALGPFQVSAVALGCMSLSWAYSERPDQATAEAILNTALDVGYTLLDTAALYGMGANETLLGQTLKHRRGEYVLASKCGLRVVDGKRIFDGTPEGVRMVCEDSLRRLQTEIIDLYYLHRLDPKTPIEDTVGALARLVEEGKIRSIGLSEVSAATLRRAHAVHPIAALQSEYSLWSRNPEIATLQACKDLGTAFVAFSPVARGFLGGKIVSPDQFEPGDIRLAMPRFQGEAFAANAKLLAPYGEIAREVGCTMAQLAIAWVLARGDHVIALPGTGKLQHMIDDAKASDITLDEATISKLDALINRHTVHGARYSAATQAEIDTEEFAA